MNNLVCTWCVDKTAKIPDMLKDLSAEGKVIFHYKNSELAWVDVETPLCTKRAINGDWITFDCNDNLQVYPSEVGIFEWKS